MTPCGEMRKKMNHENVDLGELKEPGTHSDMYEKLAHELAVEIQWKKNPEYIVVDWDSQEQAQRYFNEHGFEKTLEHMLSMRRERGQ